MIQVVEKERCCGCTACANSCPQNCISMITDHEGFVYPQVDVDMCVNCSLCDDICPVTGMEEPKGNSRVVLFQNTNSDIRKRSTSGGAFYSFAKEILRRRGGVCAVGYDESLNVVHKFAYKEDELGDMLMSKYVQSDLTGVFSRFRSDVLSGKEMMFVGTPCQVEGLVRYMDGVDLSRVLFVDLECYGVPSPKLYRMWLDSIEALYGEKVKKLFFRDKKYGYAGVNVKVVLESGKVIEDKFVVKTFTKTMFSGIGLRPSCYECVYRNVKKHSDITLGDCWSVGKLYPQYDDDLGTTQVVIHTKKGGTYLESIGRNEESKILEAEDRDNTLQYGVDKKRHPRRDEFFSDVDKIGYVNAIDKHIPATAKDKLANILKPVIAKTPFSRAFFSAIKSYKRSKGK